jgi:hypothetical protein
LIGFISFLVLLQLLKALRYRKPFAVFENILCHAAIDLVVCLVGTTLNTYCQINFKYKQINFKYKQNAINELIETE